MPRKAAKKSARKLSKKQTPSFEEAAQVFNQASNLLDRIEYLQHMNSEDRLARVKQEINRSADLRGDYVAVGGGGSGGNQQAGGGSLGSTGPIKVTPQPAPIPTPVDQLHSLQLACIVEAHGQMNACRKVLTELQIACRQADTTKADFPDMMNSLDNAAQSYIISVREFIQSCNLINL